MSLSLAFKKACGEPKEITCSPITTYNTPVKELVQSGLLVGGRLVVPWWVVASSPEANLQRTYSEPSLGVPLFSVVKDKVVSLQNDTIR